MIESERTIKKLQELQALPLYLKIVMTKSRIRSWVSEYGEDGVYVSFSGGKDSTVLLHLVRSMYPDVPAVFVDTGLEYPEIREFVKTFDNVIWLKPNMNFKDVIHEYGLPFFSKEVANNIDGARRYMKVLTDRQTDRQTDRLRLPYSYNYRRIRGIGEYDKSRFRKNKRKSAKACDHFRVMDEEATGDVP